MDQCECCSYYEYNEEDGWYECMIAMDEDEMARFLQGKVRECPYFSFNLEYQLARRQ